MAGSKDAELDAARLGWAVHDLEEFASQAPQHGEMVLPDLATGQLRQAALLVVRACKSGEFGPESVAGLRAERDELKDTVARLEEEKVAGGEEREGLLDRIEALLRPSSSEVPQETEDEKANEILDHLSETIKERGQYEAAYDLLQETIVDGLETLKQVYVYDRTTDNFVNRLLKSLTSALEVADKTINPKTEAGLEVQTATPQE